MNLRIPRSVLLVLTVVVAALGGYQAAGAVGGNRVAPTSINGPIRAALPGGATETYTGIAPCRILDTRATTPLAGTARSFQADGNLTSQGGLSNCPIPANATSIAVNLTAISTGSTGFIRGWAFGSPAPTATLLNFAPSINASNQVNIPLCRGASCTSDFNLRAFGSSADVVGDVVGYFKAPLIGHIESNGTLLPGSSGIISSTRLGVGDYKVTFQDNVGACSIATTPEDGINGHTTSASVSDGFDVMVDIKTTSNASADVPFFITVTC